MATSESNLPALKTVVSAVGSIAATAMLIRSCTHEFLPVELQDYLYSSIRSFLGRFSHKLTMVIHEFEGWNSNEIYEAAEAYLGPKISPTTRRLRISKPKKDTHVDIRMERGEEVVDTFNGVRFKWVCIYRHNVHTDFNDPRGINFPMRSETRSFELTFHYRYKDMAINSYLPYIANEAKNKNHEKKTIKIFTLENLHGSHDLWSPVTLDHPATFETLAMDPDQKDMILKDLERFLRRKEYYKKVGKAWKRGYLLYGPPGTGKSSLIAAIANYFNFDINDLELTALRANSELRRLLVATANKSILVVEDIDCTIDLQGKLAERNTYVPSFGFQQDETKVTLSGLLNFVDGLWSSCGDERIIIFTTNHIEKLDPALLRPGRMDVHINMSYCTPSGFKLLASNYLGIKEHSLYEEIEELIRNAKVTPAEVAEQLLKDDYPDVALGGLIEFLDKKTKDDEEADAEKEKLETVLGKMEDEEKLKNLDNGTEWEDSMYPNPKFDI